MSLRINTIKLYTVVKKASPGTKKILLHYASFYSHELRLHLGNVRLGRKPRTVQYEIVITLLQMQKAL